jgi:hypothetical protein
VRCVRDKISELPAQKSLTHFWMRDLIDPLAKRFPPMPIFVGYRHGP